MSVRGEQFLVAVARGRRGGERHVGLALVDELLRLRGSRLATATSVALPALRIAFQFLRAMFAVPRIPQRQVEGMVRLLW